MEELQVPTQAPIMQARGMLRRENLVTGIQFGTVTGAGQTVKNHHDYVWVKLDEPLPSGQSELRLYAGRFGRFEPGHGSVPNYVRGDSRLPDIAERVAFSHVEDKMDRSKRFILAGGYEATYLSAAKSYRGYGNSNWSGYRLAELDDLVPGAELTLACFTGSWNPGSSPLIGSCTIRLNDPATGYGKHGFEDILYVFYDILEPLGLAFKGCYVNVDGFLGFKGDTTIMQAPDAYIPIVKLGRHEVARTGSVCKFCGEWVPSGTHHIHDSWGKK